MEKPDSSSLAPDRLGETEQPSIYNELQMIARYAELPTEVIEEKVTYYTNQLTMPLMPHAREEVGRILNHLVFELYYRSMEEAS